MKLKTFEEVYKLPLKVWSEDYYTRVFDSNDNFVFQFCFYNKYNKAKKILEVINGEDILKRKDINFYHKEGYIYYNSPDNKEDVKIILIRGWGNLTGTGGMYLPPEDAANIQDTFAEFIVEQLNKRNEN